MMSRKDYIVIAKAVSEFIKGSNPPASATEQLFGAFARHLSQDNPRFDSDKFEKACVGN